MPTFIKITPDSGSITFNSGSSTFSSSLYTETGNELIIRSYNTSSLARFRVDGTQGTLFQIDDSLSGSLFSVNDISGIPILEVFSDDRLVAGKYGSNDFVISGSRIGIGTATPSAKVDINGGLTVSGSLIISSSLITFNKLGVGTASPVAKVHISGSVASEGLFEIDNNSGTTLMYVSSSGNVGIKTSNPLYPLDVRGQSAISGSILVWGGNRLTIDKTSTGVSMGGGYFEFINSTGVTIGITDNADSNHIIFKTRPVDNVERERVRITAAGNVGIGITAPTSKLHISSSAVSEALFNIQNISGNSLMYVSSSGNVGIGTSVPSAKLDVSGSFKNGHLVVATGSFSHAEGYQTTAIGIYSHTEGNNTKSFASGSHSEGYNTTSSGIYSHAEGDATWAAGTTSHAEGYLTTAYAYASHAEGTGTTSVGQSSHAEGAYTTSIGEASHAEGASTTSVGHYSHAEGQSTTSIGYASHAEGASTTSVGEYSHAEGVYSIASGSYSHAEGGTDTSYDNTQLRISGELASFIMNSPVFSGNTIVGGSSGFQVMLPQRILSLKYIDDMTYDRGIDLDYYFPNGLNVVSSSLDIDGYFTIYFDQYVAHTYNMGTLGLGSHSHVEGVGSKSKGAYSHAEGAENRSFGYASHAEGILTKAIGNYSHTEGQKTTTKGLFSHAEGQRTIASGSWSHSEGVCGFAPGAGSHVEGYATTSTGWSSHAEGNRSISMGGFSHAEGYHTTSIGQSSHAEGNSTSTFGNSSHTEGYRTIAFGENSHTEGSYTRSGGIRWYVNTTTDANGVFSISGTWATGYFFDHYVILIYDPVGMRDIIVKIDGVTTNAGNTDITIPGYPNLDILYVISNYYGGHSHAEGNYTVTVGGASHAEGESAISLGVTSHAEGLGSVSVGESSHAEGYYTISGDSVFLDDPVGTIRELPGDYSEVVYPGAVCILRTENGVVVGTTIVSSVSYDSGNDVTEFVFMGNTDIYAWDIVFPNYSGKYSHAEGCLVKSAGLYSHAEGDKTTSIGLGSHAEGVFTTSVGQSSHAEGYQTISIGQYSHSEGKTTISIGQYSHAEGYLTGAVGEASHAEGFTTTAVGAQSHTEGESTVAIGYASHAEGNNTTSIGELSHAEGEITTSVGNYSHSEGYQTISVELYSHAEGHSTISIGQYSHAEGYLSTSIGIRSHAEGYYTTSVGQHSHAEGYLTRAIGNLSHAEGQATSAIGAMSHAEGYFTMAIGNLSHAEGEYTTSIGLRSHTEGYYTIASGSYSHVQGAYNTINTNPYSFIIGNGTADGSRSNLVYASGSNFNVFGNVGIGTNTPEYILDIAGASSTNALRVKGLYTDFQSSGGENRVKIQHGNDGNASYITMYDYDAVAKVGIGSANNSYFNGGNVGIGINAPTSKLHISASVASEGLLNIQNVSGTSLMYVSSSGNVGIGIATPEDRLSLEAPMYYNGSSLTSGIAFKGFDGSAAKARIQPYYGGTGAVQLVLGSNAHLNTSGLVDRYDNAVPSSLLRITQFGMFFHLGDETADAPERIRITTSGNVGIGTTAPTTKLHVSGSTLIQGSGSALLRVVGSTGELFNVTDSLSGSLFSVNDISGLPIFEVFSDGNINLGDYQASSLYTTKKIISTVGNNTICSVPTSLYDGAWFEYIIKSGSNARMGRVESVWAGSSTSYTETTTTDMGDTSGVRFMTMISGSNMILTGSFTTANWTVKTIVRAL